MGKVHLFSSEHYSKFSKWDNDKFNATACGYVRSRITTVPSEVTCKLCLRELHKGKINSMEHLWKI